MTLLPAHRIGLSIAALVFAADQALKWWVTGPLGKAVCAALIG